MPGDILLPPSPNWFLVDAVDGRDGDGLLVTAAYRTLVVYRLHQDRSTPKVLKIYHLESGKCQLARLHWSWRDEHYGRCVALTDDNQCVSLLDLDTGAVTASHTLHQKAINGIGWGEVDGEGVVVTVGGGLVVWQPRHGVTRTHTLAGAPQLTAVEVNPRDRSQALVASLKTVFLVSLKNGHILTQLKGHEAEVYSMSWFPGDTSPLEVPLPNNTRADGLLDDNPHDADHKQAGKQSKGRVSKGGDGPYFASSDYARNILVWDVSARRYVAKASVPLLGHANKKQGKEKAAGKQHIALAWHDGQLYSSSPRGELFSWTLTRTSAKYKLVHHLHVRPIYNVVVVGSVAVTTGQDRHLHGYHLARHEHTFQLATLGASGSTLAFCPHDSNRLAIGTCDNNIKVINFGSLIPLKTQNIFYNITGKVLSTAWHPAREGWLLFGTSSGQVGWADVASGRVTTFAHHHQRSVYKVDWAPPVCPDQITSSDAFGGDDWCAYSYGDRDIVVRSARDPMADPVNLKKFIEKFPEDLTEFAFSPDYKYLAIGSQDGQIVVYRSSDLAAVVTLAVVKNAIQHLVWQPPRDAHFAEVLAVGSKENDIYLFDMKKHLYDDAAGVVTQASRVLSGHASRVVWLAWSPHQDGVLASASYDNTVQLWNTNTGEAVVNYGGHMNRVFRVEFSPSDPDLVLSLAEENCVHQWRPSELLAATPAQHNATLKDYPVQKINLKEAASEDKPASKDAPATAGSSSSSSSASKGGAVGGSSRTSASKKAYKSFFPKLHALGTRKKSFQHLMILNLLEQTMREKENERVEEENEEEEELEDEICEAKTEMISSGSEDSGYSWLVEREGEVPEPRDLQYALAMYGPAPRIDALMQAEIEGQMDRGNDHQAALMHCWRGSLGDHIRWAARQRKLTEFLVASAPQVSWQLWQFACESYAEQLEEEGDVIGAASYLVNLFRIVDAVNLLVKHRHYREALAIAKSRMGCNQELTARVVAAWVAASIYEGSFDVAALLNLSVGQIEAAAKVLSRKTDLGSLFVSAKLYSAAENVELANAMALLALKEASHKQEHVKILEIIKHFPDLHWYKLVSSCHKTCLQLVKQATEGNKTTDTYMITSNSEQTQPEHKETSSPEEQEAIGGEADNSHGYGKSLLEEVKREWDLAGIEEGDYPKLYDTIKSNFSMQQIPSSVKQLWYLVSVEVCCLVLASSRAGVEHHLVAALGHAVSWARPDQLHHLTHALLPRGTTELITLGRHFAELVDVSPAIRLLSQLYDTSEIYLLHAHLQDNPITRQGTVENNGEELTASVQPEKEVMSSGTRETEQDGSENVPRTDEKQTTELESKLQGLNLNQESSNQAGKCGSVGIFYRPPQSASELAKALQKYADKAEDLLLLKELTGLTCTVSFEPQKLLEEMLSKLSGFDKGTIDNPVQ